MDMYSADMEYRFDWRAERDPSYEDIVFCLEIGWKDEDEAVEARDGVCSITDILAAALSAGSCERSVRRVGPLLHGAKGPPPRDYT